MQRTSLLLNGFMATGKSTVGKVVAARTNARFVDLDHVIEARAGRSIPELFAEHGEPAFRAMEAEALASALAEPGLSVIALGGGALLDPKRRRAALASHTVVTLSASIDAITSRAREGRPLLDAADDKREAIRALLTARSAAYAEAHARIETDGREVETIAAEVIAAWERPTIAIPLGDRSYSVTFARDEPRHAADRIAATVPSMVFVVTDENVAQHWGSTLDGALASRGLPARATVTFPPGEEHKTMASIARALGVMVEAGADRDALVVGHGGGVVTDMAGFTAATLLRGARWIALPTTLLAMVDASVGGKTGVDVGPAKNAAGAFHQPRAVVIDAARVTTEGERGYVSGLAEVVKAACIGDPDLLDLLESEADRVLARDPAIVEEIVLRAVAVKAVIVARDEREGGERAVLNFGHTIGHALEARGGFTELTHGEAVSLGMIAALRVGASLGAGDERTADRVRSILKRLGLPVDLDEAALGEAMRFVAFDKKRRAGAVRFIVLDRLGAPSIRAIDGPSIARALGL